MHLCRTDRQTLRQKAGTAFRLGIMLAFACLTMVVPALAAEAPRGWIGPWAEGQRSAVRLVAAPQTPDQAARGELSLGLDFRMDPGWKLYWRSPGDAGLPPAIDAGASPSIADGQVTGVGIAWPLPERFTAFETIHTYAYEKRVLLPVTAGLAAAAPAAPLRLRVDYQVCEALCIPVTADLVLDVPAGPADPLDRTAAEAEAAIAAARAAVPAVASDPAAAPFAAVSAGWIAAEGDAPARLVVEAKSDAPFGPTADVFIEGPDGFAFLPPEARRLDDGRRIRFVSDVAPPAADARLLGETVRLTLVDGTGDDRRAVETTAQVVPAPATLLGPEGGLAAALLIGLLGGLILNVMPCVLPVLSIKLMGLVATRGLGRGDVRASLLATAAGILLSFLALALAAAGLKLAGVAVGWGIQFQQPAFIGVMIVIMALFAASQLGVFTIRAPVLSGGLARDAVPEAGGRPKLGRAMMSGVVATLLATPCSAPFVGTALGFALAGGTADILAVFAAMGLGMALPYLAIAAVPSAIRLLPRPGRWMVWVKVAMGVALAGTALWLTLVLSRLVQPGAAAAVAVLAALAALLPLVITKARLLRWTGVGGLAVAAVATAVLASPPSGRGLQAIAAEGPWTAFEAGAITAEVAKGRVVFVDVTASWCVTCIVNEERVLAVDPVAGRLATPDVVAMKADWTRPDPAIADYLAGFGRYGIPFNVVYGPAAPQGLVLPELLTADAVTRALDQARGNGAG
ncbi:protein-disulfide reductase DsbD family protein [Tistrella mobilis]|uniref:protein-disulfide reductase DsbD family protein n=1 Tax=Tistrella mobilis TaxID=171437 RepID=UPI0035572751